MTRPIAVFAHRGGRPSSRGPLEILRFHRVASKSLILNEGTMIDSGQPDQGVLVPKPRTKLAACAADERSSRFCYCVTEAPSLKGRSWV